MRGLDHCILGVLAALVALGPCALAVAQDDDDPPAPSIDPPVPGQPASPPMQPAPPARETICDDRIDNDGDGLTDCADADCFGHPHCEAGGREERTNEACSDWIDNDGDGAIDCEDDDCQAPHITVCRGSWQGGVANPGPADAPGAGDVPELSGGMSVEDLIGRGGDVDGERNDYLCSDGIDNDGDGRIDCQDFGCRFDPSVTVCSGAPGIRFSVVAGLSGSLRINETPDIDGDGFSEYSDPIGDVRVQRLQLRALGPIPLIQNSFFLINVRAERSLRLTFATFNIPLGNEGHYLSVNTGSGGLSPGLVVSTAKQPLLDPPFYLFNAFEQANGAALEVGGPITSDNVLRFRVFAMGGSGERTGNVGGVFFRPGEEARNFSYSGGAQLHINAIGFYDRFDTPFLYVPVPLTLAFMAGARFDQRPIERFVAWNAFATFRYSIFAMRAEAYGRYVIDFDGVQQAWNVQFTLLLVPRTLVLAADVGGFFVPVEYDPAVLGPSGGFSSLFRQPVEEFQVRAALHWYYFRNIGLMSLMYSMHMFCVRDTQSAPLASGVFADECRTADATPDANLTEHEIRLETQFRF
ncbi:MAG: hypothetical protein KF729_24795 [Sandaracinaceae bacterium]|nr:hypothetical protein [Sandaracinaceae bacterium]